MSDFIYSSTSQYKGVLTEHIKSIYHNDPSEVSEFHGEWGSLAVSRNLYNGFQPLETDTHIFVVIGGPVLYFRDNCFLTGTDPIVGTQAIYERWQRGTIQWDEDLSGPFAVLVVDKVNNKLTCVTDLMMFIPVFMYATDATLMLGTHVDALAKAADQSRELDLVALADFILNDVVTYPYTAYKNINQCLPAAIYAIEISKGICRTKAPVMYWQPRERNPYASIDEAATVLREGLQDYVNRVTEGMKEVAHFISAGEDSRVVADLTPKKLKRDAFVFLDRMNREGRIAKKVADAYGAHFHAEFRKETHYLDILPEASDLIGSGHQYTHAHSLQFHRTCGLDRYNAVFGGYISDGLFKAMYIRKSMWQQKLPFIPQLCMSGETRSKPLIGRHFDFKIVDTINRRRRSQMNYLLIYRAESSHEWFALWPATAKGDIPYFYSNRRLFRSYEPFMSKEAVKISAAVPTGWKVNRRLFNKAFRPYLKTSCWIFHADGRLPYFPWWINSSLQFVVWLWRKIGTRAGMIKGNQGPWGDWERIIGGEKWKQAISEYRKGFELIRETITTDNVEKIFEGKKFSTRQKINLLQVLYILSIKY